MNKTTDIPNAFDIDIIFFGKCNNFQMNNKRALLSTFYKLGMKGYIYHPKQISNFFPKHKIIVFLDYFFIMIDNNIHFLPSFINKILYNTSFQYISDLCLHKKYDTLNDNFDLTILVYIGYEEIGYDLIKKIIKYKTIQADFNVAICFNYNLKNTPKLKKLIMENFDFYSIYKCNDYGTDIIPTLFMYNDINKTHKITHYITLHTKKISNQYYKLTNFLLNKSLSSLLKEKRKDCNCIGHPDQYISLSNDSYNQELIRDFSKKIHMNHKFIGGTIFYTTNDILEKVVEFVSKNNYRQFLLNNLYENNSINKNYSPIHFIERLFGVIN